MLTLRSRLTALALAGVGLAASLGLGAPPAGAADPQCEGSEARAYVCSAYVAYVQDTPGQGEVDYWAPLMPAKKTTFISTLGRSLGSRHWIVVEAYQAYADRLASFPEIDYWRPELLKPDGFRRLQAALYEEFEGTPEDLVDWAYYGIVGREADDGERTYWAGVAEAKGAGRMTDLLAGTLEVRRTRVRFAYLNELGHFPDTASRDYWAEQLRTGTSYLNMRIALDIAAYPAPFHECTSLTPPARPGCEVD